MRLKIFKNAQKFCQGFPLCSSSSILAKIFLEQNDDFDSILGGFFAKSAIILIFLLILFANTAYNLLFIHYEKYGGDPMKRSLINQLVAQACCSEICLNFVMAPLMIFRVMVGPIGDLLAQLQQTVFHSALTW